MQHHPAGLQFVQCSGKAIVADATDREIYFYEVHLLDLRPESDAEYDWVDANVVRVNRHMFATSHRLCCHAADLHERQFHMSNRECYVL